MALTDYFARPVSGVTHDELCCWPTNDEAGLLYDCPGLTEGERADARVMHSVRLWREAWQKRRS